MPGWLSDYFCLDLDAPTLPAYERVTPEGLSLWGVWCTHCDAWHWHGAHEGHRYAHCTRPGSPYEAKGYNLALAGAWFGDESLP